MKCPVDFDDQCQRPNWFIRQWRYLRSACCGFQKATLVCLPTVVDSAVRTLDRGLGRSFGGVWQRLFLEGHSVVPLLFMLTAIAFTVLGPTPRFRGWLAVTGMFVAVAIYWAIVRLVLARRFDGRGLLTFQIVLVVALYAIFSLWLPAPGAVEASPALYSNVFAPVLLVLLVLAAASYQIARWVMRGFPDADRELFAKLLANTELFVVPRPPEPSMRRFLHGFINAPLYHPLHLLLLPALVVIAVEPQNVRPFGFSLVAVAWLLLTFTGMYDRLSLMITVVRRWFLVGGQLVVSLVVIGVALARVFEVPYVTTVLDSTSDTVILYYVVAAYTAFWLYEYWINRALTERLLPMLVPAPSAPERLTCTDYKIARTRATTGVLVANRAVEVFAAGRFAVTGAYKDADSKSLCPAWQSYDKTELFARLAQEAKILKGWTGAMQYQANVAVAELAKRTRLYFNLINVVLIAVVWISGVLLYQIPERAEAVGVRVEGTQVARQPVSLREMVFVRPHATNKVILLAASGGGTRAAVYTASALRGIAALGWLDDVVLVSGVSGGSAALAYYALHRGELHSQKPGRCNAEDLERIGNGVTAGADAWCIFIAAMAKPYIEDVLRGASETDIYRSKSFGHLLDESFMRNFGVDPAHPVKVSDINRFGLILNTTIAGHPASDSTWLQGLYAGQPHLAKRDFSVAAGGRLIFTNLREVGAFPRREQALQNAQDEHFRYVIVGGEQATVTAAAALSANFPPVFSNARVDVLAEANERSGERYWVTDGGAADNRGIISLLYALNGMLAECERPAACPKPAPEMHVVIADASAVTIDYSPDRGGGSILGAANKFASQLMLQLFDDATARYAGLGGKLVPHYLPMPAVLRMRGGLGTHWMMPEYVTLRDICEPKSQRAAKIEVKRLPLIAMIVDLHAPVPRKDGEDCKAPRSQNPVDWLATDRHARAWYSLVSDLGPK